jgi:hypothetical protein
LSGRNLLRPQILREYIGCEEAENLAIEFAF